MILNDSAYLKQLKMAAVGHDISKCDYRNRLNQNKLEHNQGKASTRLLIECGIDKKEFAFGLKLIENHHRRVQSDDILKKADELSSELRLEGGNTNLFMPYFELITNHVKEELTQRLEKGYNHDKIKKWILYNGWLDIVPADINCSLESQSLREHLIQTELLVNRFYNDRKTKDFSIHDLVIPRMDRKKIFLMLEKEKAGTGGSQLKKH